MQIKFLKTNLIILSLILLFLCLSTTSFAQKYSRRKLKLCRENLSGVCISAWHVCKKGYKSVGREDCLGRRTKCCVPIQSAINKKDSFSKFEGVVLEEDGVKIYKNLAYADLSEKNKLDLYIPVFQKKIIPVILWFHGGGMKKGDKAQGRLSESLKKLSQKGYAVASVNYRLLDEASWPAQLHDAKAAVRWIRASAEVYNFNSEKIGTLGTSAGGNLAMFLGTTGGIKRAEGNIGKNLDFSSSVSAVVELSGSSGYDDGKSKKTKKKGKRQKSFGAINFITEDDASFLIIHAEDDRIIPVSQGRGFHQALLDKELDSTLIVSKGRKHGGNLFNDNFKNIVKFFDRILKN